MNNFALKIWDDETAYVTFYTIHRENDEFSETDKFFLKFRNNLEYKDALQQLTSLLFNVMGEEHGANKNFFTRHENAATALPPVKARISSLELNYAGFPLRLYCYRINDHLVVLFNGDIKTTAAVQEDSRLALLFNQANHYVRQIDNAFREKIIMLETDRNIVDFQGNTAIYFT
jgi:hypothetical protein